MVTFGYFSMLDKFKALNLIPRGKPILLLDGGLGTTLEDEHQITFSATDTPTWSSHLLISSPDTLLRAHKSFVDVGVDIILTATYQASFDGFARTPRNGTAIRSTDHEKSGGYTRNEAKEIMRSAVSLARSAFGLRRGLVALSLGPYGATMIPSTEYTGTYCQDMERFLALEEWHTERLRAFEEHEKTWNEIDIVAFETLPRVDEIECVRGAVRLLTRPKPFWVSCVFPNEEDKLPDGSEVIDVVKSILGQAPFRSGATRNRPIPMGIGINCTKVQKIRSLIRKFEISAALMHLPLPYLLIYPNGANGLVYDTTTQNWIPEHHGASVLDWDEEVFNILKEVQERNQWAGVIVGGCCKTKPQDIARLREQLNEKK